jgi:hypothetical protein|tara:strand:- start:443 stop:775 length:333 start_codon:yes stop_codon:yes gene_type:complete
MQIETIRWQDTQERILDDIATKNKCQVSIKHSYGLIYFKAVKFLCVNMETPDVGKYLWHGQRAIRSLLNVRTLSIMPHKVATIETIEARRNIWNRIFTLHHNNENLIKQV